MTPGKRIFVNTLAQYTRALVNTCLSLYTVRFVLQALGKSDYGIYVLVAGVISLLGFITNAMVITTQRNLSYSYGLGDEENTRKVFSNSLLLHIVIAICFTVIMLLFQDFLIYDYLEIESARRGVAWYVYLLAVVMLFVTFLTAPFKALFIAHENIVYISAVEIMDGVLKFVLVLTLLRLDVDKLLAYGCLMMFIIFVQFLAFSLYAIFRFGECRPTRLLNDYDITFMKQLSGFAGWTTYGMGAVILRNQGLAILINRMWGTAINASYGIAQQAYGAVSFVATSVLNAMNPQIMKAEGQNNRELMFRLAIQESKFITTMMAVLFIPLMMVIDDVLGLWLSDVPENTALMCNVLLCAFLVDQSTYGLHTANQAIGRLRSYSLLIYTPKLLFVPICWIVFRLTNNLLYGMLLYVGVEALVAVIRIPFMRQHGGLNVGKFLLEVPVRIAPLVAFLCLSAYILRNILLFPYSFLFVIVLTVVVNLPAVWYMVLNTSERKSIANLFNRKKG